MFNLGPWPKELASSRKLKTCVYQRLRLAKPSKQLRWLAMACAHFGRDKICTQVDASFNRLTPYPTESTQVEWRPFTNYYPTKYRICRPWNGLFGTSVHQRRILRFRLATQRMSRRKFNLRLPVTTCESVSPGLNNQFYNALCIEPTTELLDKEKKATCYLNATLFIVLIWSDVNECLDGDLYNCTDEFHKCANTRGSYKCECEQDLYFIDGKCRGNQRWISMGNQMVTNKIRKSFHACFVKILISSLL